MCGIAGVLGASMDTVAESEAVAAMLAVQEHRGPDGSGLWSSPNGRAVFGHRRLSIVDLSEHGAQPMTNEDRNIWITYNGEVYNSPELREVLLGRGHRFESTTDTECIVHLFEDRGRACVEDLHGDFGFAVHDVAREETVLVRDRIGVKPLYYAWHQGKLLFASEIKGILAYPGFRAEVDPQSVYHYLTFLVSPAPRTMFKGVFKLEPGHLAVFDSQGTLKIERWWDSVQTQRNGATEKENVAELDRLLRESIRKRMMSDVPFGVFLSGGVDSSTNVALMSQLMSRPVDTYSVAFAEDPEFNELNYARDIAKRFEANHHEVVIDWNDLVSFLPRLVYHQDEPLADPVCVPLFYVAELAKRSGTTVVQVGEGADEIFCGYLGYMRFLQGYRREWKLLNAVPRPVLRAAAEPLSNLLTARGLGQRADIVRRAANGEEFFWGGAVVFSEDEKQRLMPSAGTFESSACVVDRIYAEIDSRRPDGGRSRADDLPRAAPATAGVATHARRQDGDGHLRGGSRSLPRPRVGGVRGRPVA